MQEARNGQLLVESVMRREIQQVDAVELVILALLDQVRDRIHHRRIGRLPQR